MQSPVEGVMCTKEYQAISEHTDRCGARWPSGLGHCLGREVQGSIARPDDIVTSCELKDSIICSVHYEMV